MAGVIPRGDWHDGATYARLLAGDRRCFAWEWLRRDPAYSDAWATGIPDPAAFGLLAFVDPDLDALAARPFWDRAIDRAALRAEAYQGSRDCLDLRRLAPLVSCLPGAGHDAAEHILLSDGLRSIRIDVVMGSLAAAPAMPRWRIDGIAGAGLQIHALRQLASLAARGRFARSLHAPERRARRWTAMLRVHDAIAAGVVHREIVAVLFGVDVSSSRWRTGAGPWRLRAQRLAAGARACLAEGPARWLGGDAW
jgi:hypothetical protein